MFYCILPCFNFNLFFIFLNRNEYTQLFIEYQPLSLAHGFTDAPVPKYITETLAATAKNTNHLLNQYTRDSVSNKLLIG